MVVLIGIGVAGAVGYPGTADAQRVQLDLDVTTTETDAPANAAVESEQPVVVQFEYAGLGDGTHELELMEKDSFSDDTIREFTVEGDSGRETFELTPDEVAATRESGAEYRADLFIRWGEEETSNTKGLMWQPTTVYTDGYGDLPDEVQEDEEITIEYYGWTAEPETHVRLMEDDPPHRSASGGNDETIRRESVSGPGYFEGSFTFVPSEFIASGDEEGDGDIETQARAAGVEYFPDLVRNISVATPSGADPNADAVITDVAPEGGGYHVGEDVPSDVEVENRGDERHTFFVGYGVVGPNGDVYDNDGETGTQVSLSPGEQDTVTVSWTVEEAAPTGSYTAGASVWAESNPDRLETRLDEVRVQNAFDVVETATGTETASTDGDEAGQPATPAWGSSPTDAPAQDIEDDGESTNDTAMADTDRLTETGGVSEQDGPGLGAVSVLIAVLIGMVAAYRRA